MATITPNYGLNKDGDNDYYDVNKTNSNLDIIDSQLKNIENKAVAPNLQKAGGTATAITLTNIPLVDGNSKTFIVTSSNNSSATTINGKSLYKPGTTNAPKLIAGKAVTVWYDLTGGCFFIKASAEGTAVAANVLAGKTFSNDDDTGIAGAMANLSDATTGLLTTSGITEMGLGTSGFGSIGYKHGKVGYHNENTTIRINVMGLLAENIKAGVKVGNGSDPAITLTGTFTSDATAVASDMLNGKTAYINGNKVTGTMGNNGGKDNAVTAINKSGNTLYFGVPASGYYQSGYSLTRLDNNWIESNIKSGVNIFGKTGTLQSKQSASGTVISGSTNIQFTRVDGTTTTMIFVEVFGLTFTPKLILVKAALNGYEYNTLYENVITPGGIYAKQIKMFINSSPSVNTNTNSYKGDIPNARVDATSFKLPVLLENTTYTWYAFE
jgi:hypothetical protein